MTVTNLGSDASTLSGTVTLFGGAASAHAGVSDGLSTTGIELESIAATAVFDLETKTLAPGEITKSVWLTYSARQGPFYLTCPAFGIDEFVYRDTLALSVVYELQLLPVTLTQSQLDAAQVTFERSIAAVSSENDVQIARLNVELVTVTQPVVAVTAVSPDPYTASTTVPVSWSNTLDTDGGAATRYQVVVTDDNDGDAVVVDSGQVLGSVTSLDVGPLPNGNYTVSVRVGQTVNGAAHWSAYDTDTFEVDVVTADVDTVTPVATDTDGLITVTVARDGASQAWEFIEVERSINGTWSPVRGATFVDATGNANSFVVADYEVPNAQAVTYRARATYYSSGLPITGAWVSSSSVTWTGADKDDWLKNPSDPSKNIKIEGFAFGSQSRSARAGVFNPLGSSETVVVLDVLTSPLGSLSIRVEGQTEALAVDAILASADVLLLNLHPDSLVGPNRDGFQYIAVLSTSEEWEDMRYLGDGHDKRQITVPFARVASPPDPLASAA